MKSISKIIAMFLLLIPFVANAEASTLQQDNKSVTVIVSDNVGVMPGANVVVKGTTNGGITDVNGAVSHPTRLWSFPSSATTQWKCL